MSNMRMTISVDDGHPLDLRMAELLDRHRMQATFYLPVTNDEGAPVLSASQMRRLATRFEIGSHTRSHRFLTTLDEHSAWQQIADGKHLLEDHLGNAVAGFCYPGGRYRRLHVKQVRTAGFLFARTTQSLRIDAGDHPFELPTTVQFYPHPRRVGLRNFVSQRHWRHRAAAMRTTLAEPDWQIRLRRLLALADARGSVFHLWCHSLDIDRLQLWDALHRFLDHAALRVPPAHRIPNSELLSLVPAAIRPAASADPADPADVRGRVRRQTNEWERPAAPPSTP